MFENSCWGSFWEELDIDEFDFDELIKICDDRSVVILASLLNNKFLILKDELIADLSRKTYNGDGEAHWCAYIVQEANQTVFVIGVDHAVGDGTTLANAVITMFGKDTPKRKSNIVPHVIHNFVSYSIPKNRL